MKKSGLLYAVPVLALLLLFACNEVDIRLINQIKTFGPKWAIVGGKLDYIDRNLGQMERRFKKDIDEVKPILGSISDTLKTGSYYRDLTKYDGMVVELDTLRGLYKADKATYSEAVPSFNEWEKKVLKGDVAEGIATSDLTDFKQAYGDLDARADSIKSVLETMVSEHNRILRSITDKLGVLTNYDIELK